MISTVTNHGDDIRHSNLPPFFEKTFDLVLAIVLFLELAVLFGNVMLRVTTGHSLGWANEIAGLALTSLAFIGGAIAYHRGVHMSVRLLLDRLPESWQKYGEAAGNWVVMVLAIVGLYLSFPILASTWDDRTPVLELRKAILYLPFATGMFLLLIFSIKRMFGHSLRTVLIAGAIVLGCLAVWFVAQNYTGPWVGPGALGFAVFLLFLLVYCGVPIGFVLPSVAFMYLTSAKTVDLVAVPVAMNNGISGFIMLAIPFFILAGNIMTEGGLARPLADCVCSFLGQLRGGLMHAVVVSMYIFSGISGSKVADVAAVGTTLRDMLRVRGYRPAESAAVFAGAAVMGETVPPSIAIMVLASITTLSVGSLFVAGILPAAFMALCLMALIFIRSRLQQWPKCEPVSWLARVKITLRALPALLVPFILIYGIVGGIATPTEVSSFAVVYAIIVAFVIYRGLNLRGLLSVLAHAGTAAGMILFIISMGSAFSWTLTIAGLPQYIGSLMHGIGGSIIIFQAITVVALMIMGSLLEGLPALLIFVPLLMPLAMQMGLNPMHYGIVLIIAMGLGSFLPPFGIGFYVTCSVLETNMEEFAFRLWPYVLVLVVGLTMVTFIPWFSLALPNAFHLSIR